ncbi:MAG: hypothetical protein ACO1SV_05715 [Fimbriimonas sp.]
MFLTLLVPALTAQSAVMIRYAPPVGTTTKYRMSTSINQTLPGQPASNTMTSTIDLTLKVLARNGSRTTVETTTGRMKLNLPASAPAAAKKQMEDAGSGTKTQAVMSETGAILSAKSVGKVSNPMAAGMGEGFSGAVQGLSFPNRAVKVGETWKASLDMGKFLRAAGSKNLPAGMTISGVLPITTKLVAVRQRGGKALANLKFTMAGTLTMGMQNQKIPTRMNSVGDCWIEVGTGIAHSMKTVATSTTGFGGRSMVQKITTTMTKI